MIRELRAVLALAFLTFPAASSAQPLTVIDVPFIAQSELLCGGAAAAMVMRYWGERGIDADAFQPLVDEKAGGIRTAALAANLRSRGWQAIEMAGTPAAVARELQQGRPVITLIEDRPHTYHYVVVVARNGDGVIFHDPARAPFRVASVADFDTRWSAARQWMLVVTPPLSRPPDTSSATAVPPATACDALIADGVRQAQQHDLAAAERTFAAAIACPGAAPFRELAGVRVMQRRWPEAEDLATTAVARDRSDQYAWRLLATARFVSDKTLAALDAWNHVDEPRVDLLRVDGLTRTRQSIVEHVIGLRTGETLTRGALLRGRRRLSELPAGSGVLDFVPRPGGLAEIHATVAERPLVPRGAFDLGVIGLATAITREVAMSISSPTGGGEQIALDWRFWAHRPLYRVSIAAPAPWRGVWRLGASRERQPFSALFSPTVHDSLQLDAADWASGIVRWQLAAGVDRWNAKTTFATSAAGVSLVSAGNRIEGRAAVRSWFGGGTAFERAELRIIARSSARMDRIVVVADGGIAGVSSSALADLWVAGDTGRARPLPLRAHPVLGEEERLRTERLGRLFAHQSTEVQRWWRIGPFRAGAATFLDLGRTARRATGAALTDADVGVGLRAAYPGRAGAMRLDFARGLRDGQTAVSVIYTTP